MIFNVIIIHVQHKDIHNDYITLKTSCDTYRSLHT